MAGKIEVLIHAIFVKNAVHIDNYMKIQLFLTNGTTAVVDLPTGMTFQEFCLQIITFGFYVDAEKSNFMTPAGIGRIQLMKHIVHG